MQQFYVMLGCRTAMILSLLHVHNTCHSIKIRHETGRKIERNKIIKRKQRERERDAQKNKKKP